MSIEKNFERIADALEAIAKRMDARLGLEDEAAKIDAPVTTTKKEKAPAKEKAAPVVETPAAVVETPAAAVEAPVVTPAAPEKKITLEALIEAFRVYAGKHSRDAAGKILSNHGVKSVRELAQDKYAQVMSEIAV